MCEPSPPYSARESLAAARGSVCQAKAARKEPQNASSAERASTSLWQKQKEKQSESPFWVPGPACIGRAQPAKLLAESSVLKQLGSSVTTL